MFLLRFLGFLFEFTAPEVSFLLSTIIHPKAKIKTRAKRANAKSDNMFPACFGRRDQTQLPSNSKRDWICLPLCYRLQQICHASSQPFTYTLASIPTWYLLRDFAYKQGRNFPFVPDWLIHSKVKV